MRKICILLCLAAVGLQAQNLQASYDISYGLFGKLGDAGARLEINGDRYKAVIKARATGLARVLSNGMKEIYTSTGTIKDGVFIPSKYTEHTIKGHKDKKVTYVFDHKNKTIRAHTDRKDKKTVLQDGKRVSTWQKRDYSEVIEFYAKDDILTLFFNIKHRFGTFEADKRYRLKAIGASSKDADIYVFKPTPQQKQKLFDGGGTYHLIVTVNKDIFESQKGELLLTLNEEGLCQQAVLEDVLLFGDITGKATRISGF